LQVAMFPSLDWRVIVVWSWVMLGAWLGWSWVRAGWLGRSHIVWGLTSGRRGWGGWNGCCWCVGVCWVRIRQ